MTLILQSSMSCKYNSPDNGMIESFFGILKSEMFYGHEKTFKSIEHLEQAIVDYINYYNNKRIDVYKRQKCLNVDITISINFRVSLCKCISI